jgi:hypothetical protein
MLSKKEFNGAKRMLGKDLDSHPDLRVCGSDILIRKKYKGSRETGECTAPVLYNNPT